MSKIPGSIRVQCTHDLRRELKKNGSERCFLMLDEIKSWSGVKDAWFTNNKETDILVELEVSSPEQGRDLESKIKSMDGVEEARLAIALEA